MWFTGWMEQFRERQKHERSESLPIKLKCPECQKQSLFRDDCMCNKCFAIVSPETLVQLALEKHQRQQEIAKRSMLRLERKEKLREKRNQKLSGVIAEGFLVRPRTKNPDSFKCLLCGRRFDPPKETCKKARRRFLRASLPMQVSINGKRTTARPCSRSCRIEQLTKNSLGKRAGALAVHKKKASSVAFDWKQQMAQLEAFASQALQELENDKGV